MRMFTLLFALLVFPGYAGAQSPVSSDAEVEKIAEGFEFVEGPVWMDSSLLFSDIPANTIYQWTESDGIREFLSPSGQSNGLALDSAGHLLLAQHAERQVARLQENGTWTALATEYQGKRLNSPNDMAIKSDGSVFFTDPPYGIQPHQEELGFYGIYRYSADGELYLLDQSLNRPNGIVFSPDESHLYVNDSETRRIYVWDVQDDSVLVNKRQFAYMQPHGYADGMAVDAAGHVYSTGPIGVWVFAPDGTVLDTIAVPGQTSNCTWGDADRRTLYITSGDAVYRIRVDALSRVKDAQGRGHSDEFGLAANYPNPFNESTRVRFKLDCAGFTRFDVYNARGQCVQTLMQNYVDAGVHTFAWNASDMSGGAYIIRMVSEDRVSIRKCTLLR